jgi:hypothetical protein
MYIFLYHILYDNKIYFQLASFTASSLRELDILTQKHITLLSRFIMSLFIPYISVTEDMLLLLLSAFSIRMFSSGLIPATEVWHLFYPKKKQPGYLLFYLPRLLQLSLPVMLM